MKKMFAFLLAMVMLFSCVSAASAAEVAPDADIASDVVAQVSTDGEIAEPITTYGVTALFNDVVYNICGAQTIGAWAPAQNKSIGFAIHPFSECTVTIRSETSQGKWKNVVFAKKLEADRTWEHYITPKTAMSDT